MTAFENYFRALKKVLEMEEAFDIWPDFEPQYDEKEFWWETLRGLGESLILNCGRCDGPSDLRNKRCKECVRKREQIAKETYQKVMGRPIEKWSTIMLCRLWQK
ncbi:hypothetical protein CW711_00525 [Candidatus Bathyarchaeota archaeon]|nr:MAG: hypothetical protein CW680_01215 [Candidatus Bathyarchaeota archaeon]RJS80209.1 MAG: hypothetical protein CW711_00525 [Candidatus Bathyarchaeota archaeon]